MAPGLDAFKGGLDQFLEEKFVAGYKPQWPVQRPVLEGCYLQVSQAREWHLQAGLLWSCSSAIGHAIPGTPIQASPSCSEKGKAEGKGCHSEVAA